MEVVYVLIGAVLGFIIGLLIQKGKSNKTGGELEKKLTQTEIELKSFQNLLRDKEGNLEELKKEFKALSESLRNSELELIQQKEQNKALKEKYEEFKIQAKEMETQFKDEFKNLASSIIKEQSKDFSERNEGLLKPFREQLKAFEQKVQQQQEQNIKNANTFELHMKSLKEMNDKISLEATNLTNALKGENKTAGNWGELILERVLESSGLIKGSEYKTQVALKDEDNNRKQPDAVVFLPDEKHIIIDSKVSLVAYDRYVNAESEEERTQALKEHIASIKTHVKGLSEQKYNTLEGISSPDFTLLFVPVEASFGVAVKEDIELFQFAWDKNIVIVSPSTLLATLKTVSSLWKQEKQNKNVLLIAEESGKLYDKFVGFLKDLERVEESLGKTQNFLTESKKKLATGNGNIIGKIEKLKELGAKASKNIDQKHLD